MLHSLALWYKRSLLFVIPFSERKTEIVPSQSSVITMDVWVSQNIKFVIYKSVDVLKSGNVSMYKALLKLKVGHPSVLRASVDEA